MKKILLILLSLIFVNLLHSQDIIFKTSDQTINAKVLKITSDEVIYKAFDNLNGPEYTLKKSEIEKILYENGKIEEFSYVKIKDNNKVEENDLVYWTLEKLSGTKWISDHICYQTKRGKTFYEFLIFGGYGKNTVAKGWGNLSILLKGKQSYFCIFLDGNKILLEGNTFCKNDTYVGGIGFTCTDYEKNYSKWNGKVYKDKIILQTIYNDSTITREYIKE